MEATQHKMCVAAYGGFKYLSLSLSFSATLSLHYSISWETMSSVCVCVQYLRLICNFVFFVVVVLIFF